MKKRLTLFASQFLGTIVFCSVAFLHLNASTLYSKGPDTEGNSQTQGNCLVENSSYSIHRSFIYRGKPIEGDVIEITFNNRSGYLEVFSQMVGAKDMKSVPVAELKDSLQMLTKDSDVKLYLVDASPSQTLSEATRTKQRIVMENNGKREDINAVLKEYVNGQLIRTSLIVVHVRPPFLKQVWNTFKEVAPVITPIIIAFLKT